MNAIGPGDWVECVDDGGYPDIVAVGSIHFVEEVCDHGDFISVPCLILRGVVHPAGWRRVRASCFRPIYRPQHQTFDHLLVTNPEEVSA